MYSTEVTPRQQSERSSSSNLPGSVNRHSETSLRCSTRSEGGQIFERGEIASELSTMPSEINCVLIAPTGACNLQCQYCLSDAPPVGRNPNADLLGLEKAQSLLDYVLANSRFSKITVIFQGGEPTLVPTDWYEILFSYASQKASKRDKSVRWCVQTNGQKIDGSWIDLFKRHNVGVGVSIDGTPGIAAAQRSGTQKTADSILLLRENGIYPGAIVVGTPHNLPEIVRIHEFLAELGIRRFHVLPLMPLGRAKSTRGIPASMITGAYVSLVDSFLRNPGLPREDRLYLFVERFISNEARHLTEVECLSGIKPCGKQLIFLDSSGGIFPCSYAAEETLKLGETSDHRVCWSAPKATLDTDLLADEFSIRCLGCRAKVICGFSCAAVNFANPTARENECEFYQSLMEYFVAERGKIERLHRIWIQEEKSDGDH